MLMKPMIIRAQLKVDRRYETRPGVRRRAIGGDTWWQEQGLKLAIACRFAIEFPYASHSSLWVLVG